MLCNVIPGLFFIEQDLRAILEFKRAFQKTVCADDSIFTKTVLPVRSEVTAVMECQFRSLRNCISKKEYLQGDKGTVLWHLEVWLQYRLPRNSRCFSRLFREKTEFYGENPIAKRFGMGFSQATVHALDRACTVARSAVLYSSI